MNLVDLLQSLALVVLALGQLNQHRINRLFNADVRINADTLSNIVKSIDLIIDRMRELRARL